MEDRGLWPQRWFVEVMQELHRVRERERRVSTKNAVLVAITFVAVLALILGMGVVDSTGSLVKGYPLVLPSLGWLILFSVANQGKF